MDQEPEVIQVWKLQQLFQASTVAMDDHMRVGMFLDFWERLKVRRFLQSHGQFISTRYSLAQPYLSGFLAYTRDQMMLLI